MLSATRGFHLRSRSGIGELALSGPGVMVYWHVERKSVCVYSQLKKCSSSEVAAMMEGLIRHAADVDSQVTANYTDTHGGKLVFGMFALMAEYEASLVRERILAGLAAARARNGARKPKMTPALIDKVQRMYDSRQFTMAEIAASCGVTPMTIYRNIRSDTAAHLTGTISAPATF